MKYFLFLFKLKTLLFFEFFGKSMNFFLFKRLLTLITVQSLIVLGGISSLLSELKTRLGKVKSSESHPVDLYIPLSHFEGKKRRILR